MSVFVPMKKAEAAMMYNNTLDCYLSCQITQTNKLTASMEADGFKGTTTRIGVELYVEKRVLGVIWKRIDIGYTDNVWVDSTTHFTYSNTFSTFLNSSGVYRTTVTFTVSGTGGADDVIVKTSTVTY